MKIHFQITLVIFTLLTLVNILGGILNQYLGYAGQLKDVIDNIPLHLIFCLLFWLTSIPKMKLPTEYRVPTLRIFLWSFIVIDGFVNGGRMESEDLLYHFNQSFCFLFNTLGLALNEIDIPILHNTYFQVFGIHVFGVALYEFTIIKMALKLYRTRVDSQKSNSC